LLLVAALVPQQVGMRRVLQGHLPLQAAGVELPRVVVRALALAVRMPRGAALREAALRALAARADPLGWE
jgi:hypothetical protein